jgi:rfaE bifunctional protein kinase chain/domain
LTCDDILARIPALRALVVGDICLDRWCTYDPALSEPSRETGLPRTAVTGTLLTAGAGGTVANNLAALGAARVSVLGTVGDDGHGYELRQALARAGIDSSLLVTSPGATFAYTKLLNKDTGEEDLGRVDFLSPPPPPWLEQEIVARLVANAPGFDCLLVADQMETETGGVVTAGVRDALAKLSRERKGLLIWVDSRLRIEHFRGVVVKPNEREAREACARLGVAGYRELRDTVGHPLMMVTHGGDGVLVLEGGSETWVPARPVAHPVDICGAGDSFSAGAALALAAGAQAVEAAHFGNLVASITIMKKGTGTASPAEVLAAEARAPEEA